MTKDGLQEEVLYALKNRIQVWTENKEGATEAVTQNQINLCNKVIQNIEEATSIVAAKKAAHLLYLYASDQMHIAYGIGGIKPGDQIDNLLNSLNIPKSTLLNIKNTALWDECVQKLYEAIGYKNILPTHSEIKELEYELDRLKASEEDRNQQIKLEEQLNLKKCALGELTYQWSGGVPIHLSNDVRRIAEQERRIHQIAIEASLNSPVSIKR